jgi:hypothetical protein
LDYRHVCKTCTFHDALQAGKQKEVNHTPLIWRLIRGVWWKFYRRGGNPRSVTANLRSIPKEAFTDSFQKLYERYQQCVVKDGDYFEGQLS